MALSSTSRIRHWCLLLALAAMTLVAASCGSPAAGAEVEIAPRPGAYAPTFQVQLLDGRSQTLEELRGHPLILNFWATWCGPCRRELPLLQALAERPNGTAISVLAVNYGEEPEVIAEMVDEEGYTLPVALDPDQALAREYLIQGMPTTFFIDGEGIVQRIHIGELSEELLHEMQPDFLE